MCREYGLLCDKAAQEDPKYEGEAQRNDPSLANDPNCEVHMTLDLRGARPVCDGPFATARSPILVTSPRSARWCQDLGRGLCHVFTL